VCVSGVRLKGGGQQRRHLRFRTDQVEVFRAVTQDDDAWQVGDYDDLPE
jgi:hypothetical protein